ncbi:hypothetical protein EDD85DRAFT_923055 [Armillaria nabsnona]|nr:hypothetical protein EDD85DRAFT_923055 [Armillaria nabsnona]
MVTGGCPCDQNSIDFPDSIPSTPMPKPENVAEPFENSIQFQIVDFLFCKAEMSQGHYQIWYQDPDTIITHILSNSNFCTKFNTLPYVHVRPDGKQRWCNFMSDNYVWKQSGAMYVAIILGSDKTTVSVATENVEVCDWKHDDDLIFCLIKKQLYHSSIATILNSLKPAMTQPVIIYDLGAFIAGYLEQVLPSGIVSGWCAKCTALSNDLDGPGGYKSQELTELLLEEYGGGDGHVLWHNYGIDKNILPFTFAFPHVNIYEIPISDLLHQIIKGTFKDHLIEWVSEYLMISKGKERAKEIMDDIDHQYISSFEGCHFKQWTGDDLKVLMKVYLPACLASFMDFYYLIQHTDFDEETLNQLETTIAQFHAYHQVFITTGVHDSISLPCQHSLVHYCLHIINFGAPNGLCSSIMDQILLTNQQLDKLTALHAKLASKGLVTPNHPPPPDPFDMESKDAGAVDELILAELPSLTWWFLYDQLHEEMDPPSDTIVLDDCPEITSNIYVYHSAGASFYAPIEEQNQPGFSRMSVVWVLLFFSFIYDSVMYPCTLVYWFKKHGQHPDKKTGLWIVKLDAVISTHLIPIYGSHLIPHKFDYAYSLDCFRAFYVNKYPDYHSNEIFFS